MPGRPVSERFTSASKNGSWLRRSKRAGADVGQDVGDDEECEPAAEHRRQHDALVVGGPGARYLALDGRATLLVLVDREVGEQLNVVLLVEDHDAVAPEAQRAGAVLHASLADLGKEAVVERALHLAEAKVGDAKVVRIFGGRHAACATSAGSRPPG